MLDMLCRRIELGPLSGTLNTWAADQGQHKGRINRGCTFYGLVNITKIQRARLQEAAAVCACGKAYYLT